MKKLLNVLMNGENKKMNLINLLIIIKENINNLKMIEIKKMKN